MKSCLGTLLILSTIVVVLGGGGLIWYLSSNAEFTRKDANAGAAKPVLPPSSKTPAAPKAAPRAAPVR